MSDPLWNISLDTYFPWSDVMNVNAVPLLPARPVRLKRTFDYTLHRLSRMLAWILKFDLHIFTTASCQFSGGPEANVTSVVTLNNVLTQFYKPLQASSINLIFVCFTLLTGIQKLIFFESVAFYFFIWEQDYWRLNFWTIRIEENRLDEIRQHTRIGEHNPHSD